MYTLLDNTSKGYKKTRLENLAYIPLEKWLVIVDLVATTDPHIQLMWVVQVLANSFSEPSDFYGMVVSFIRDIVEGITLPYVMVDTLFLTL